MCYKNETLKPIMVNGSLFDFFPQSGHPMIMSYIKIDKEILAIEEAGKLVFSGTKKKRKLCSIKELRGCFNQILNKEEEIINRDGRYKVGIDLDSIDLSNVEIIEQPFRIDIQSEERELLIDQLIFDILFCKYCEDSPLMTLRQYSIYQSQYSWSGDQAEQNLRIDAVRKCISNALKKEIAVDNSPGLREEIMEMGINPDKYFEYYGQLSTPFSNGKRQEIREKSKVQWDELFYNGNGKLITCKQYDRSFSSNGNYSHKDLVNFFDTYDGYIKEVFMPLTANSKDYL